MFTCTLRTQNIHVRASTPFLLPTYMQYVFPPGSNCTRTCMCTLRTLCMHTLHAHRANTCSTPARALLFQKNVVCIIRIYKHLRVGTHECVYACKYACLCVCLYARINVRTYVCMNACVCACICVYVHLCATHVLQRMHLRANRRASVNV